MYKTAKRTETYVQNFPPWAAILAPLFAWPNDWELAFQIQKSSSLVVTSPVLGLVTLPFHGLTESRVLGGQKEICHIIFFRD